MSPAFLNFAKPKLSTKPLPIFFQFYLYTPRPLLPRVSFSPIKFSREIKNIEDLFGFGRQRREGRRRNRGRRREMVGGKITNSWESGGTFLRWKRSRHRASTLLVTKETYENMEETNSLSISLGQTLERNTKIS